MNHPLQPSVNSFRVLRRLKGYAEGSPEASPFLSLWPVTGLRRPLKKASAQGHGLRGLAPRADARRQRRPISNRRRDGGTGRTGNEFALGCNTDKPWPAMRYQGFSILYYPILASSSSNPSGIFVARQAATEAGRMGNPTCAAEAWLRHSRSPRQWAIRTALTVASRDWWQ